MTCKTYLLATLLSSLFAGQALATPAEMAGSQYHSVFINNGAVFGMGNNTNGEIAPASGTAHLTPYFTGHMNAKSVHANYFRTAVLFKDGTAKLQGLNTVTRVPDVQNFPVSGISDIALAEKTTYYISAGQVFSWIDGSVPIPIAGGSGAKSVAAGYAHLVVLFNDGTVGTLGKNANGQLGNGTTVTATTLQKLDLTGITDVAAGESSSFARTSGGTLFAWGVNASSNLGVPTTGNVTVPTQVPNITAKSVHPGRSHTIVVREDGTVWATGWHNYIGDSFYNTNTSFRQLPVGTATDVAVGGDQTLLNAGTVGQLAGWGGNHFGKLGDGSTVERHTITLAFFTPIAPPPSATDEMCNVAKTQAVDKIGLIVALTCGIKPYDSMNACIKANPKMPKIGSLCQLLIVDPKDRGQQEKAKGGN